MSAENLETINLTIFKDELKTMVTDASLQQEVSYI